MKTYSILFKVVAIALVVAMLAGLAPRSVFAQGVEPQKNTQFCDCKVIENLSFQGGYGLIELQSNQGSTYFIGTHLVNEGQGQRLYFGVIKDQEEYNEIKSKLNSTDLTMNSLQYIEVGNSWISWDSNRIRIYIDHDTATVWKTGGAIVTILCGILALIPLGALPGLVCATISGLSTAAIDYYDSYGNPGFYILGTLSPLKVWIEP